MMRTYHLPAPLWRLILGMFLLGTGFGIALTALLERWGVW